MAAPGPYPVPPASPARKPPSTSKQILLVTVPAVVALAVGVWLGAALGPSVFGGSTPETQVAPPTTAAVDTTTPTPEPTETEPPDDELVVEVRNPLGEPVTSTSGCTQGGYVWSSATIERTRYDSALVCSFVSDRPSVDYMVPAGATTFTATVGLDDSSAETKSSFVFNVIDAASGKLLWHKNVSYGDSAEVEADVEGTLRVRLEIYRTRGTGADEAVAVWGNPKMF